MHGTINIKKDNMCLQSITLGGSVVIYCLLTILIMGHDIFIVIAHISSFILKFE